MQITDPIADMLTRIRNANNAKHDTVDVPASNMKKSIAQILLDEGYIKNFQLIDNGTQGVIRIALKYNAGKEKVTVFWFGNKRATAGKGKFGLCPTWQGVPFSIPNG